MANKRNEGKNTMEKKLEWKESKKMETEEEELKPVRVGQHRKLITRGMSQRRIRGKWAQTEEREESKLQQQEDLKNHLFRAVEMGDCNLVTSLFVNGASLDWVNNEGMTPLVLACTQDRLFNMVVTLIKLGCISTGPAGASALYEAASNGLVNTVALLLSCGADPLMANHDGQTSLDIAREKGHVAIVRIIEDWICYFGGYLRELQNSKNNEKKLVSKKVWAVVLPPCSNGALGRKELVIYASRKGILPTRVIILGNFTSEIREPNWSAMDPYLTILDKVAKTEFRFRAEIRGDKHQLMQLHEACTQEGGQAQMLSNVILSGGVRSADDIALEMAIKTSIQTALREGVPLSRMVPLPKMLHPKY